ncbi:hypothetical protein UG55_109730 [Frankia sp. EI5c]|nr:hypothetical protein UG55_109730 [Frankia sp. EI5c]
MRVLNSGGCGGGRVLGGLPARARGGGAGGFSADGARGPEAGAFGDLTMVVGVSGAGAGVAIARLKGSLCLLRRRLDDHGDAGAATPASEGHTKPFSRCQRILADPRRTGGRQALRALSAR